MEERKISFSYWKVYLLASDYESPSMILSKSIEVWLDDWLGLEEVEDILDYERFY